MQKTFEPPSFDNPIVGYSCDFASGAVAFDYNKGARPLARGNSFVKMPKELADFPMSLWHVALELHVGRMYTFLGALDVLFVFFSGMLFLFVLVSGYVVYRKRHRKRRKKKGDLFQNKR